MEVIGTKVPPEVKREVKAEAQRAGMSMAAWLRLQLLQLTDRGPDPLEKIEPNDPGESEATPA